MGQFWYFFEQKTRLIFYEYNGFVGVLMSSILNSLFQVDFSQLIILTDPFKIVLES